MSETKRRLVRRPRLPENHRPLHDLLLSCFLFLAFILGGHGSARGSDLQRAPAASAGPEMPFAIADFDGDLRPDVARVQTGLGNSSRTAYLIQLQLTAFGRNSISVLAPTGGLRIAARDVNGDRAVDLVLVAAWLNQPVAIFLNDGQGKFARADLAAFPGAFQESKSNWISGIQLATASIGGIPPEPRAAISREAPQHDLGRHPRLGPYSNSEFIFNPFLLSSPGRAPPACS